MDYKNIRVSRHGKALSGGIRKLAWQLLLTSSLWSVPLGATESERAWSNHVLPATQPVHTSDARREALLRNVISVTGAEYDWPCHVMTAVHQLYLP